MNVPEKYRLRSGHPLASDSSVGNNGAFVIPHFKISNYFFLCIASDGMGWQHVSVSMYKIEGRRQQSVERCPNWEEMCRIKDLFWSPDEAVMQIHPPEKDYVSNHHFCLHLWKPDRGFPLPDPLMVGTPSKQVHL